MITILLTFLLSFSTENSSDQPIANETTNTEIVSDFTRDGDVAHSDESGGN